MLSAPTQEAATITTAHANSKAVHTKPAADNSERRVGMAPIPDSIDLYLNEPQLDALQTMEYFGWQLFFVRRSDLNNIVPVIKHAENSEFAVLDAEGDVIREPDIGIRH